jgi:hypothetical protein
MHRIAMHNASALRTAYATAHKGMIRQFNKLRGCRA